MISNCEVTDITELNSLCSPNRPVEHELFRSFGPVVEPAKIMMKEKQEPLPNTYGEEFLLSKAHRENLISLKRGSKSQKNFIKLNKASVNKNRHNKSVIRQSPMVYGNFNASQIYSRHTTERRSKSIGTIS